MNLEFQEELKKSICLFVHLSIFLWCVMMCLGFLGQVVLKPSIYLETVLKLPWSCFEAALIKLEVDKSNKSSVFSDFFKHFSLVAW